MSNQPLGLSAELGALIPFTTKPFLILSSKILNPESIKQSVRSQIINGFLKSGLSVPYFSIDSLKVILGNGGCVTSLSEYSLKIS